MRKENNHRLDAAVSPVVGVMLMLVVTIIIAAVVSAFAGGLSSTTAKSPTVSMDVKIDLSADDGMGGTVPKITFKHISGDPIHTKDLEIITYFTNTTGYVYKHTQSRASDASILYTSGNDARVPYHADMTTGYAYSNPETKDFGNFSIRVGDVMTTGTLRGTADLLGLAWSDGADTSSSNDDTIVDTSLKPGSIIDVKILHTPSGKYIYDKEVTAL